MPKIDLTGQRFGRLAVLKEAGRNKGILWLCLCDCGKLKTIRGGNLRNGSTRSCGCLYIGNPKHGHGAKGSRSPTYITWSDMRQRCRRKGYYNDLGITVCERWHVFENFLTDMGERPNGTTIDRINNDGNYEPANCRWATPSEQSKNRRPYKHKPR